MSLNFTKITIVTLIGIMNLFLSSSAIADWAMFSEQDKLKGHIIVEIGEISHQSIITQDYHELDWYEFNDRCMLLPYYVGMPFNESALLLIDEYNIPKVAIIETSISSINIEVENIELVQCPDMY